MASLGLLVYTPLAMMPDSFASDSRALLGLLLLAGLLGCASPPEGPPEEFSRAVRPRSHVPGASFVYEGTLRRNLVQGKRSGLSENREYEWKLTLRDFVLDMPGSGGTEMAIHIRTEREGGGEPPSEDVHYQLHRSDGRVEALGRPRAFHPATGPLLRLPRQVWFSEGSEEEDRSWTLGDEVKLSEWGSLDADFHWEAAVEPEGDGLLHLARRWNENEDTSRRGTAALEFKEEFWVDAAEGHLVRYRREWRADWMREGGKTDTLEQVEIELQLREAHPRPAEGEPDLIPQLRRLQAIREGLAYNRQGRDATERRIREFRRDFPDSPLLGALLPIEAVINKYRRILDRDPASE